MGRNIHSIPVLGGLDDYKKIIELKSISKVISTLNNDDTKNLKKYCAHKNVSFSVINFNIE